jgi:hypothetical protein
VVDDARMLFQIIVEESVNDPDTFGSRFEDDEEDLLEALVVITNEARDSPVQKYL